MAVWMIITVASAFMGVALILHAVTQCKQTNGGMLQHYRDLLAEVRKGKEKDTEKDSDAAVEPPESTPG